MSSLGSQHQLVGARENTVNISSLQILHLSSWCPSHSYPFNNDQTSLDPPLRCVSLCVCGLCCGDVSKEVVGGLMVVRREAGDRATS